MPKLVGLDGGRRRRRRKIPPFRYFPVPKRPYETGQIWNLGDREFRMYHYLAWKTWGFKRESSPISVREMREGFTSPKTGYQQAGLGWSERTIRRALDKLAAHGWIKRTRTGTTRYSYSIENQLLFDEETPQTQALPLRSS